MLVYQTRTWTSSWWSWWCRCNKAPFLSFWKWRIFEIWPLWCLWLQCISIWLRFGWTLTATCWCWWPSRWLFLYRCIANSESLIHTFLVYYFVEKSEILNSICHLPVCVFDVNGVSTVTRWLFFDCCRFLIKCFLVIFRR